jgi:hypothetical protein
VFRKCACGGGESCKCNEEAQAAPDRETVAMLARSAGNSAVAGLIQRDDKTTTTPKASKLDGKAQAIVTAAQGSGDEATRGVEAVKSIIDKYFKDDAGLVKDVVWKKSQAGLNTESSGKGKDMQGTITVGHSFLQQTTEKGFARRVLQVDHELEHVRQHRAGMGGEKRQDEREFLAFQREALEKEFEGTGRIAHSTRVDVIDAALGYYYCLVESDQKKHSDKKEALLKERENHNGKAGNAKTDPPTGCSHAND